MRYRWFVDNPIKITMCFVALLLMGVLSYRNLPLNLFPDLQTPRITIVAATKGLPADQSEKLLTADLERQLSSIKGVAGITSYTRDKSIVIHVDFRWGQDMEFTYLDVKKNLGSLETNDNIERIEIFRFDPNAEPLITLAFTGKVDRIQATNFVENSLKPRLEAIEGVAYVRANGVSHQEVQVRLNEGILSQYQLTPQRVLEAIKSSNISAPGGVVVEGNEEMELKLLSRFRNVDDIGKCVVTVADNNPIHLSDVGEIKVTPTTDDVLVRQDGSRTITLDVFREPDANAVFTARRVREAVQTLNTRGGYGLKTAMDQSVEVEASIREVIDSACIGMILAMLVLLAFLRNIAATLIVAIAIPISIICTFSLMFFQHLSLNIMTLGGLALGSGMLIDNGIVVTENIFRHRQSGGGAKDSAAIGTSEVALAITASTLAHVVIFVPLVYVHGVAGILFRDQALTVVYSLLMSLFVALALVPMLAARSGASHIGAPGAFTQGYGRFLASSLRYRWMLLLFFAATLILSWTAMRSIPSEFMPPSASARLSMLVELPVGTPLDETESAVKRIEQSLLRFRYRDAALAPLLQAYEKWTISADTDEFRRAVKQLLARASQQYADAPFAPLLTQFAAAKAETEEEEAARLKKIGKALSPYIIVESVTSVVGIDPTSEQSADDKIYGPHTARVEIVLNPDLMREFNAADLTALLRKEAARIPGMACGFESKNEFIQQIVGKSRGDVVVEVHAEDLKSLRQAAEAATSKLATLAGLTSVRSNLVLGEQAFTLEPDQDSLTRGRFKIEDLSSQIQTYLRGSTSDRLKLEQGEMAVTINSTRSDQSGLDDLLELGITSSDGGREKLRNLVHVRKERAISEIMRVNQEKTLLVMADLKDTTYEQAIRSVTNAMDSIPWQTGASWNFSGEETKRRESFQKLLFALVIAILLVYMVIAASLESIIHPLTIMLSVPFALSGVVAAFLFSGISLNIMGYIGIVMLVGIVVNNAIVLLDRVHQLRQAGRSVEQALVEASMQRLRPIAMTSITAILALIPLALGFGNGAELRRPMAIAVIGGLCSSTLLTLLVLPALYLCVEETLRRLRARLRSAKLESLPSQPEPEEESAS